MKLYQGPSRINGEPIRSIATGLNRPSINKKTGPMVQVWFLPSGDAFRSVWQKGTDASVCGSCSLRAFDASGSRQARRCYVNVAKAPRNVAFKDDRGGYPKFDVRAFEGKAVRFGAFGDPVAVPFRLLAKIARIAKGWTGYTHQWKDRKNRRFREIAMASVETLDDKRRANRKGFRTFRVIPDVASLASDEILCPASKEADIKVQCVDCLLCSGTRFGTIAKARNVAIVEHK